MDNKNKIFFAIFFTLIAGVAIVVFTKYFVAKDYYIQAEAECDPASEECFVATCDPANDPECSSDPAEQTSYTKLVMKKANQIPDCDPADENCPALKCFSGQDCEEILCDESTIGEGQECNDPQKYLEENPPVDDQECVPDDENCANPDKSGEECSSEDESCKESGSGTDQSEDSEESDSGIDQSSIAPFFVNPIS
jgi:hypothetical protein